MCMYKEHLISGLGIYMEIISLFDSKFPLHMTDSNWDIVEDAETHGFVALGVMAWWTGHSHPIPHLHISPYRMR